MTFRNLIEEQQNQKNPENLDFLEYQKAIVLIESGQYLNEGILDNLTAGIKKKVQFIKDIAQATKLNVQDAIVMFKDSRVFKFFKTIGFSFKKLFVLLKKGYKAYQSLESVITKYIADQGGVKYVKGKLDKLDEYLQAHPVLKKLGGVAVSALLIYIWLNMAYNPDLEYSMSWEDMINALMGKFSLADLFASAAGIKMLSLFAAGTLLGLSFPWPGPQMLHMAGGIMYGLYKILKPKGVKIQAPTKG